MTHQVPDYHNRLEIENPILRVPPGYFQEKADLQTGNVIRSYYNIKPKVTFCYPQDPRISHEKSNKNTIFYQIRYASR